MPETRRTVIKNILISLTGAAVGSGSVWQLAEWMYKRDSAKFERMKIINDFRKDKDHIYAEIIKLTEEYLQTVNEINKTPDAQLKGSLKSKIQALHAHLDIKKSNFSIIESNLAK